ncbi:DUF883 domain-containing protein [Halomonas sp. KAO]|uniref:DUF883 family protein n=1 Tax=unclassified Halomonas TaxID=2609666 RepID=UPI00189E503C|nr:MULTISPECIES: DUF883 family protein [unclassified Halomonas]MBF7051826.1 DUF883 domain-containing protein [Halomonas sp. KAO]MDT0502366.1 DUF883 family protein [Halomonas sp. PAR7]MDT0510915.1 DUF883 family protein [Halomonas sp. LES1]MDT0592761.1 DUF883 family protein [Halomonas sp. PAR8]
MAQQRNTRSRGTREQGKQNTRSRSTAKSTGQSRTQESTAQLKEDLHQLTQTIEELIGATADDSRSNIKALRDRAEKRLKETRERLESRGERLYGEARDTVDHRLDVSDRYVHDNPWTSLGIGTVFGVIIGMLLGRR